MINRLIIAGLAILASLSFFAHAQTASPSGGNFKVDPSHSTVVFRTTHLGVAPSWGAFPDPTGTFIINGDQLTLDVTLDVSKIETYNDKRDEHLRGPDFFNVRQFPTATFKGQSTRKISDMQWEVQGQITIKGVTKPLTVTVNKIGEKALGERFGYRAGFETEFTINRMDFGVDYMPDGLGQEVRLIVAIEGIRE